eukprot:scaffold93194_cov53-Attheya_sp.AAC.1
MILSTYSLRVYPTMSSETENGAPPDEPPMDDGETETEQGNEWTKVGGKKPTGTTAKTPEQRKIENRGQNLIETSDILITQIKLEFNISRETLVQPSILAQNTSNF